MIFIYEVQENYPPELLGKHPQVFSILEGHRIFNFLFHLDEKVLNQIDAIYLLNTQGMAKKNIERHFMNYSADPFNYKTEPFLKEIINKFPTPDKLQCQSYYDIVKKIQDLRIFNFNTKSEKVDEFNEIVDKSEDYLFYLPFCRDLSLSFQQALPQKSLCLVSNSLSSKLKDNFKYIYLDAQRYFDLKERLSMVTEAYKGSEINQVLANNYTHPKFLENFRQGYFERLCTFYEEDKKKIYIYGEDSYLTRRSINYLLSSELPLRYDLLKGVPYFEKDAGSVVLLNFDSLENPLDQRTLFQRLRLISHSFYVLLQGIRYTDSEYIKDEMYWEIEVPPLEVIRKSITSIFLSIIIERQIYKGLYRPLLGYVSNNLFENILTEVSELEDLFQVLSRFHDVDDNDLLNNSEMWYYIVTELENLRKTKNLDDLSANKLTKRKIRMENTGSSWIVYGLGKELYPSKMGMLYLAVIVQYSLKFKKTLRSTDVKNIAYRCLGKPTQDIDSMNALDMYDALETDRKTISSAVYEAKKCSKELKELIEEHFSFSVKNNFFDHKNILDIKVIDPNLDDILSSLESSKLR